MDQQADRRPMIAGILAVSGGAVLIVSPFFQWITASVGRVARAGGPFQRPGFGQGANRPGQGALPVPRSLSVHGIDIVPGKVALAMGIVLLAAGLIGWLTSSPELRRAMGIVGLMAGTAAASLVLYRMSVLADGATLTRIQAVASRSIAPGMVLALLGALAGVAGGVVALVGGSKPARAVPPADESGVTADPGPPAPTGPEAEGGPASPVPATDPDAAAPSEFSTPSPR